MIVTGSQARATGIVAVVGDGNGKVAALGGTNAKRTIRRINVGRVGLGFINVTPNVARTPDVTGVVISVDGNPMNARAQAGLVRGAVGETLSRAV